jgi:zinc and cadmium transporter
LRWGRIPPIICADMGSSLSSAAAVLAIYCALLVGASLAGGWLPQMLHLTHRRLQLVISFVAGLMLGMALLHLIPHAFFQLGSLDQTVGWTLAGFLGMFFLQRFLHYHHHDLPEEDPDDDCCDAADHQAAAAHPEHGLHAHTLAAKSARQLSWAGTAVGLGLHSLLDGVALAAAVMADAHGHGGLLGLGTAMAVILHKPFDAMAIITLMTSGGASRLSRGILNALFALVAPVGVGLFLLGFNEFPGGGQIFLGTALAFSAGMFLCISSSDLLPELQFHSHDRLKLSGALLLGLLAAFLIGQFETTGHDRHQHAHGDAAVEQHE